jgi:DNA repair protein RAD50
LPPLANCRLERCSAAGIRSFSPDNQNVIEFYKPLTLIVGHNGAGKTVSLAVPWLVGWFDHLHKATRPLSPCRFLLLKQFYSSTYWCNLFRAFPFPQPQTVIECLKMACTGELPPNTRSGQLFIHDPKASLLRSPACLPACATARLLQSRHWIQHFFESD